MAGWRASGNLWQRLWAWLSDSRAPGDLLPVPTGDFLPDIEGGEPNLLHKITLRTDLRLDIAPWQYSQPTPTEPDVLELFLDGASGPVAGRSWDAPIAADQWFIMLGKQYLTEGAHSLHYRVTLGVSGQASDSEVLPFTVDLASADLNASNERLDFPVGAQTEITARYLEVNDDRVIVLVPDYYPIRTGDVITAYWEPQWLGDQPIVIKTLTVADLSLPITLAFSGDQIRGAGDGLRYVSYEVADRAGNVSRLSRAVALQVIAAPPPRYWPAPLVRDSQNQLVPAALDPTRAHAGVSVWIPAQADFYADELATVFWGAPGTAGAAVTPVAIFGQGPWQGAISKAQVAASVGKTLSISYGLRGNDLLPASEVFRLIVRDIPPELLPQVQSQAAIAGNQRIRLSTLPPSGDTISLRPWPLIGTGQKISLWAEGTADTGLPSEYRLLDAAQVRPEQVNSGVLQALPLGWLAALRANSVLTLNVQVSFDGGSAWVTFPYSGNLVVVP